MAYSQIHEKEKYIKNYEDIKKWSIEKINKYFLSKTFSLDSKNPSIINRKPIDFKLCLIAANKAISNYPDIRNVLGKDIKNIDLITYSFPCQGLSIANMGRDKGIENLSSTSNFIWEIHRILSEAKFQKIKLPKYLLMENVKNLISYKHKKDYENWKKILYKYGYITYTFVLNGFEHNSLQKRKRVFAISIINDNKKWKDEEIEKIINDKYGNKIPIEERKNKYIKILNSSNNYLDEIKEATPRKTPSRIRMKNDNKNLKQFKTLWKKGEEYTFNTLTTKQDRHPNIGMIKLPKDKWKNGFLEYRFITPREAYLIMGFTSHEFSEVKNLYKKKLLTKESLYRQAGNSIVVSVLESVFKFIFDYERGKYE